MRSWISKRSWWVSTFFPLLLAGCASIQGAGLESKADQAFELAHYNQALGFYRELEKIRPDDQDLKRKIEIARTALFYSLGKEAFFQGKLQEAERWFRRILRRHPKQKLVRVWLKQVQEKQALSLVEKAGALAARGHADQAMDLLDRSLRILPGNQDALALQRRLLDQRERILEKGRALVKEGLKTLREAIGEEGDFLALYHLEGAKAVMADKFQFTWLLRELEQRYLARAKREILAALEKDDYALVLFLARYAQSLFPDQGELRVFEKEARAELDAQVLAERAHNELLRGNPDRAEMLLKEAARLSKWRSGIYLAGLEDVREARLALAYEEARDRENEGLYEEALAGLKKVAALAPD